MDTTNRSGRPAAALIALGSLFWPHLYLLGLGVALLAPLTRRHRRVLLSLLTLLGRFMLTIVVKVGPNPTSTRIPTHHPPPPESPPTIRNPAALSLRYRSCWLSRSTESACS